MRASIRIPALPLVRAASFGAAFTFAAGAWAQGSTQMSATEHLAAARAAEDANQPVRAADEADRVIVSPDATYAERETAKHVLENVGDQISLLLFQGDGSLSIDVDDGGEERSPARHRLAPGEHDVVYRNLTTGAEVREKVVLPAGDVVIVKGPAPPKAPGADLAKHPPLTYDLEWHVPAASWIAWGLGVAATAAAVGFGIATLSDEKAEHAQPTLDNQAAFSRNRTLTFVSIGTAVVGAAAGTIIYFVAGHEKVALYPTVTVGDWRIGF